MLILERPGDTRYLERIQSVDRAFGLGITVWTLDREGVRIYIQPQKQP